MDLCSVGMPGHLQGRISRWVVGSAVSRYVVCSSSMAYGRMVVWSDLAGRTSAGSLCLPAVLSLVVALSWVLVWLVAQALSVILLCATKRFVVIVLICSSMECGSVVVRFCGL